jgi:hypothetical protein
MAFVDDFYSFLHVMGLIFMYGWPFMILIWLFFLKTMYKKWPIDVVIIEKRGSNLIKTNDRCGRWYDDASGVTCYRLQKCKDTIPVYNYDWVLHNVSISTTLFDRFVNLLRGNIGTIFLFRYGSKQYKPINIVERDDNKIVYQEVKNDKGEPVWIQVYQQFDPRDKLGALDFEVVDWDNMNFMVQEQRAAILRRQAAKELWKQIIIPAIIIGGAVVVSIFLLYFSNAKGTELISARPANQQAQQLNTNDPVATQPNVPIVGDLIPGA